ncbi:Auxin-responsive protein SAUR15 [Linum grandiflorum]
MGIKSLLPSSMVVGAKKIMKKKLHNNNNHHHYQRRQEYTRDFPSLNDHDDQQFAVPKGHIAVYVSGGDETMKRLVVPVSYVNHPKFGELLDRAEAEFGGFDHRMGAITLPCDEDAFFRMLSLPVF